MISIPAALDLDRLAREHTLLVEVIAVSPGPVSVYDDEDRLIAWNDAYARIHATAFARHADRIARRELRYADLIRDTVEAAQPEEGVEAHIASRVAAHRQADGRAIDRWYEGLGWFRVTKVRTPSGAVAGLAMRIDELVEKSQALEAARAAEEAARLAAEAADAAKSRFLALVSHELRTPLGGLLGVAALLDNTALCDRQRELVAVLRRSGADMLAVLNDLLDDAQLAKGAFALQPAPFSLRALATDVSDLFTGKAQDKGLRLESGVSGDVDALLGDAMRLRQVLGNLISNAIKFANCGRVRLDVDARARGREAALRLAVIDEGPGMSEAEQKALFEDFAQGAAGLAIGSGGSGLGLSIAKRIVEEMGGTLSLRSAPGQGSTFTVALRLPRA